MKSIVRSALVFVLLWPVSAFADLSATTSDGRPVILHDNGTWVFAPQTPPGNAPPPANDATCQAYADYSVNQQRVNLNQRCGNTGIHWNLDRQWHYAFCMSAPPAERQAISQARVNALASCAPQSGGTGGGEGGNLIINGGFEVPHVGYWGLGTTALPGWAVTQGNIDIVGTYWQQAAGAQSIDLAGQSGSGAIVQSVVTQPGRTYTLSFLYAGNPTCDAPLKQMHVGYGGQTQLVTFDTTGRSIEAMGWRRYSLTFTATGASTRISFANAGPNRGCGIALDQVDLH